MAQETALQKRLIADRVRSLALVYLTRRADLDVTEESADVGFDLLVTLQPGGRPGVRQFGVELRGVWQSVTAEQANQSLRPAMRNLLRYAPFPYPVVVFFFTMENGQGWYSWSAEPVVSERGAELRHLEEAECRPLGERASDEIIASVDRWYDLKYAAYSPARRRARKDQG